MDRARFRQRGFIGLSYTLRCKRSPTSPLPGTFSQILDFSAISRISGQVDRRVSSLGLGSVRLSQVYHAERPPLFTTPEPRRSESRGSSATAADILVSSVLSEFSCSWFFRLRGSVPYIYGEVTSPILWSRYDRHLVGITRYNALS